MATYLVLQSGRRVAEFSDEPGLVTSAAILPETRNPIVSGHELVPGVEPSIGEILRASETAEDFFGRLRAAGFVLEPLPDTFGDG